MGIISKTLKPLIRRTQNLIDTPAVVLLYHRVCELTEDSQLLAVSPSHFEEHISLLKSDYNMLTVDEFTSRLSNRKGFDPRSILITFDDGYADNYIHARPILERHKTQALFYITTSKLSTNEMLWWDALEHILLKSASIPDILEFTLNGKRHSFKGIGNNRQSVYFQLHSLIKYSHFLERDKVMDLLYSWSGLSNPEHHDYRLMTFDEVKKTGDSSSCVLGAHTHDHPVLSKLSKEEQILQMLTSKKILEEVSGGKKIIHFSYPYGTTKDYNKASIQAARESGFKMTCSNFPWQVHTNTSLFEVPRMIVRNWNRETFKQELNRFFTS